MRFVIVGAGALGSIYAAHLARAGHDVALVARGERAALLDDAGIRISGRDDFTARCDIVTDPASLTSADCMIVAVKTYDTEEALAPLADLRVSTVLSVQNGVAKNDRLRDMYGEPAVLGAISAIGGQVLPSQNGQPGEARYMMDGATVIGAPGGRSEAAEGTVAALVGAGLNAAVSDSIDSVEWSKFVGWSGLSALAVLTRLPTHKFLSDPDTARLTARVMRETGAVAELTGVSLHDEPPMHARSIVTGTEDDAVAALLAMGASMSQTAPDFRQSILQDADRGRRLEVDETLGYTLGLAQQRGLAAPTLALCCSVLGAVSRAAVV